MRGPLFRPRFWLGSFTLRWLERAFGSSLSLRVSFQALNILGRGTILTGGGGGGSFADLWDATGAIGLGGACAIAKLANNRPAPPMLNNLLACFIAFFPERGPVGCPIGFIPSDAGDSSRVVSFLGPNRFNDHLTPRQCRIRASRSEDTVLPTFLPLFPSLAA